MIKNPDESRLAGRIVNSPWAYALPAKKYWELKDDMVKATSIYPVLSKWNISAEQFWSNLPKQ